MLKKTILIAFMFFIIIYSVFIFVYKSYAYRSADLQIKKHASVIAYSVWDYNEETLEKYLNLNPYEPVMWSNLGVLTRLRKQYTYSLNAFDRAIQLAPDALDYYYKRSKTYYEMGDMDRARNDLNFLKLKGFKGIDPEYERRVMPGR